MQPIDNEGRRGPIEPFDPGRLERHLKNPDIREVRVFRIKKGMKINIHGTLYKCIAARPNGKVTLKFLGD